VAATTKQLEALAAPTPPDEIGTRPGKGGSGGLSYIDARFVFDRFDSAVGPENWQTEVSWSGNIELQGRTTKAGAVMDGTEAHGAYPLARIGVLTDTGWVWKQDIGDYSDIASIKGGVSDSIKRAAVQWGVARDLYPSPSEKNKPAQRTRSTKKPVPAEVEQADAAHEAEKAKLFATLAEQLGVARDLYPGRSTKKPVPAEVEQPDAAHEAEAAVVGKSGLTAKQKAKLFATLADAGVPRDKFKEVVMTVTGKTSTTDMTNDDLDTVLTFAEGGEYKESE
jgi:hypothetical protein